MAEIIITTPAAANTTPTDVMAYAEHSFRCPHCNERNDCGTMDPAGRSFTCLHCGEVVQVAA